MKSNIKVSYINILIYIILYYPGVLVLLFYSFLTRTIVKINDIPTYNNPDPNSLGFGIHQHLIYRATDLIVIPLAVIIIWSIGNVIFKRKIFSVRNYHFIISFILILLSLLGPFNVWFAD